MLRLLLVAGLLLGAPLAAADEPLRLQLLPELRVGAGYDDNLFLDANPAGPLPNQRRADAIFDIAPRLGARLIANDHRLELVGEYLERFTISNGNIRDALVRLDWVSAGIGRRAPLRFLVGGAYEHYESTLFPDNRFDLGGGEAGLLLAPATRVRIDARYRAGARVYPDPARAGQVDFDQRVLVGLSVRAHQAVSLGLGYLFVDLASSNPNAVLRRHRVDGTLVLRPAPWVALSAGYAFAIQDLPTAIQPAGPAAPREDLQHEVRGALLVTPVRWLELSVRDEFLISRSTAATGDWQRNQVLVSIAWVGAFETRRLPSSSLAPLVQPGQVTFRFRGRARTVAVIGDWNDWTPQPLAAEGGGRWSASIVVPSGRHTYSFLVDGQATVPPEAPSYAEDAFGGKNGVVVVP